MLMPARARGFSIIELMVAITVLGILLATVVPGIGSWMADARVRSTADGLQNAVRLAQATAVARSRPTVLALTNATPTWDATPVANGSNWFVRLLPLADAGEAADSSYFLQGAAVARQNGATVTGPALVCFNSLGQQTSKTTAATGMSVACTAPTNDVTTPTEYTVARSGGRSLKVRVYLGGRVRMCDTAKTLSNSTPDGC